MKPFVHTYKKGFTLIETLVAISVLLIVLVAPLSIAQKGIQNSHYANDQMTAVFLAQEAIEAVRELRDSNALDAFDSGADAWSWYASLPNNCRNGNGCAYDLINADGSSPFEPCGAGNNGCQLRIDSNGNYSYESGTDTKFTRKVHIQEVVADLVLVKIDVSWTAAAFGGAVRHVVLQSWMYNHYKRYES